MMWIWRNMESIVLSLMLTLILFLAFGELLGL
jgi:hypothetical protein